MSDRPNNCASQYDWDHNWRLIAASPEWVQCTRCDRVVPADLATSLPRDLERAAALTRSFINVEGE